MTIPALQRGLAKSGRSREDVQMFCPVFVVTGVDETEMAGAAAGTRKQIAFPRLDAGLPQGARTARLG